MNGTLNEIRETLERTIKRIDDFQKSPVSALSFAGHGLKQLRPRLIQAVDLCEVLSGEEDRVARLEQTLRDTCGGLRLPSSIPSLDLYEACCEFGYKPTIHAVERAILDHAFSMSTTVVGVGSALKIGRTTVVEMRRRLECDGAFVPRVLDALGQPGRVVVGSKSVMAEVRKFLRSLP